jgi:hypothetical protein
VSVATVDASSRSSVHALAEKATAIGNVAGLIHAAGVSPSQASPATILKVDLYGTALVLEEFGNVIAPGGAGVVIASQSGRRLPLLSVEQNKALATTPVDELLLSFVLVFVKTGSPGRIRGVGLPARWGDRRVRRP